MTIKSNGALGRCLGGSALGALFTLAFVPPATAQWAPPWGAVFPGEIERGLEAQGYVLTAPLVRRPGVYLADVSAGPAGHQQLIIDAKSGQVLERFPATRRAWGPELAARDEAFGEPQDGVGPALGSRFSGAPRTANVHIPAAIGPYGVGETRPGTKAKPKGVSVEHKAAVNPPLPPPAPRETAKADPTTPQSTEIHDSGPPHIENSAAGAEPTVSTPATQGSSMEASDRPKVSIVPPALFQ